MSADESAPLHSGQVQPDVLTEETVWQGVNNMINAALPAIDQRLKNDGAPIRLRASQASTMYILRYTRGHRDIPEFYASEPYARIHALIQAWYKENYGSFLNEEEVFPSLIKVRGGIFAFDVPTTCSKPAEEPQTIWFSSPACVFDEEDPLQWIHASAPLTSLGERERRSVAIRARKTAEFIRSIGHRLHFGMSDKQAATVLAEKAICELQVAARLLANDVPANRALAGWALSQAVEKTYKCYLKLCGETPPKTHDLKKLASRVEGQGQLVIRRKWLGLIPSSRTAVQLRYEQEFGMEHALHAYAAALRLMDQVARQIYVKARFDLSKAEFKMQAPWWLHDTNEFVGRIRRATA